MSESSEYPLVTFALFAYNQERYIREAVDAALAQDYPNLEIIISDDCSSDGTFEVIERLVSAYSGPHRVIVRRNLQNMGIGGHVEIVFGLASGFSVIMAAGDDISSPNRVSLVCEKFINDPGVVGVVSSLDFIDESSGLTGRRWVPKNENFDLLKFSRGDIDVHGASSAWKKAVVDSWPTLDGVIHEDRIFPFRALLMGGRIDVINDSLVLYRESGGISRAGGFGYDVPSRLRNVLRVSPDSAARIRDYLFAGRVDDNIHRELLSNLSRLRIEYRVLSGRKFWRIPYLLAAIRFRSVGMFKFLVGNVVYVFLRFI